MNNMFRIVYYRTLFSQSAASLSAGYLAEYIRRNGLSAKISLLEEGRMDNLERIFSEIKEYPVLIYKCNFQDYSEGLELIKAYKALCPEKKVFVMGYFAELNAMPIMKKYPCLDGILYGDGCDFAVNYANSDGKVLMGGLFRTEIGLIDNNDHTFKSLQEIPYPARDIESLEKGKYINIIWRNGCFGTCSFCHINLVKRPYSERSVEDVVDEIEYCYKKLGKRMFIFSDSVFWWGENDDSKIRRFAQLLKERKLDIFFMIYIRCVPFIGVENLKLLMDVGLRRVFIGIENVSPSFYEKYNKKVINHQKIIKTFESLRLSYHIGFILFYPEATLAELEENIAYLYDLKKLYRIGIIVEKLRKVPTYRRISENESDKIDIAYDYEFDDKNVGNLYNVICSFFNNIDIRSFEDVCTSTILLLNIFGHKYDIWDTPFISSFYSLINEYNDFAKGFFKCALDSVTEMSEDDLLTELTERYLPEFNRYYYLLQAARGLVYNGVSEIDKEIHLSVFHGQRRLNVYD